MNISAKNSTQIRSCIELPPLGLFRFDLKARTLYLSPWKEPNRSSEYQEQVDEIQTIFNQTILVEQPVEPLWLELNADSQNSFNFAAILEGKVKEAPENIFKLLLENIDIAKTCNKFIELLTNSIQSRINATPRFCKNCMVTRSACDHSRIGILFSGGVDCTLLARLADKLLDPSEPIDLINASFERVSRGIVKNVNYDTPDRVSARESLKELQELNRNRLEN